LVKKPAQPDGNRKDKDEDKDEDEDEQDTEMKAVGEYSPGDSDVSEPDPKDYTCPVAQANDEVELHGAVSTVYRDGVRKKRCCEDGQTCERRRQLGDDCESDGDGSIKDIAPEALLSPTTFWLRAKGRMGRRGMTLKLLEFLLFHVGIR
jgi:hypothetical protein